MKGVHLTLVSGVSQGSVMRPLLFLVFIIDLPDKITSNARLFADDCIVYREINRPKDCAVLQEDLSTLAEWESKWGAVFHPQKCSALSITRCRSSITFSYQLKGLFLELQDSTKYLGVDMQSSLSWKTHIDRLSKKSISMLGFLHRNLRSCYEETKANAYFSMARSNLEYCFLCVKSSSQESDTQDRCGTTKSCMVHYYINCFMNISSVSSMPSYL